ncbi:MAG: hypothetical protein RSD78_07465 [Oscillospiraceae bacterium]
MCDIMILYVVCFALYLLFFAAIYKSRDIFGTGKPLRNKALYVFQSIVFSAFFTSVAVYNVHISVAYIMLFIIVFACLLLLTQENVHVITVNTVWIMLTFICVRAIVVTAVSTFTGEAIINSIQLPRLRLETIIYSLVIVVAIILSSAYTHRKLNIVQTLFTQKKYMGFISFIGSIMFFYQVYCSMAFYYSFNLRWFSFVHMLGAMLTLTSFYVILWHCIKSCNWILKSRKLQPLEALLKRQLLHYRAFSTYSASIRTFKHDYNKLVGVIRSLLQHGDGQNALALLEEMDHSIQDDILIHNQFSNNMLVDAALQELANECMARGIAFDANVLIPTWLCMPPIDLNCLFSALCAQLSHHCDVKGSDSPAHIHITAEGVSTWFIISAETNTSSNLPYSESQLLDWENDLENASLSAIQNLATAYGGFANVEIGGADKLFKIKLYISYSKARAEAAEEMP